MVTCQDLPRLDRPATGGGLRAYGLGEALKKCGHHVVYSVPKACISDSSDISKDRMQYSHSVTDINEIVSKVRPDIVLFSNWGLAEEAPECDVPVVVDFNGPLVLENLFRGREAFIESALTKIRALTKLDLVIVGSEAQKTYLIAWCLMAGMGIEDFAVEIVPFSLSPDMPKQQPPDEPIFVIAGYDLPWLDGQNAIETVNHELERLQRGHLHIYTSSPPYTNVVGGENSSLDSTGNLDVSHLSRVTQHAPVSFKKLTEILCQSSVALDVWNRNLERELAFPSRTATYLWAGLPVITHNFGGLSHLIERYKAGWTLEPSNNKCLIDLVENIVTAPECLIDPRANARRLAADHLTWNKTIEPLDRFCRAPQINRRSSPLTFTLNSYEKKQHVMEKRISDLQAERELMGMVHRRPKGFAVFTSTSLVGLKLRRILYGSPILLYLAIITSIGQILHKLWLWRRS